MSDVQSPLYLSGILSIWIGLVIAVVGGIISFTNFFYSRKKDKFNSLFEVFSRLNDNRHREARRIIYYGYNKTSSIIILGFDAPPTDLERACKDMVRDDFDQMGLMVETGLIPEKPFMERYWKTVIDCRWHLEADIAERRAMRGYEDYVKNFDLLRDRACNYAKRNNLLKDIWKERCSSY